VDFSLGFPTKILYAFLISSSVLHVPPLSSFWFDHPNDIWWRVQVMKLLIMQSSPVFATSSLIVRNILLSTLFSNTLNLCHFVILWNQVNGWILRSGVASPLAQTPSWRTATCRLTPIAYSIHRQLLSTSGVRLLHPRPKLGSFNTVLPTDHIPVKVSLKAYRGSGGTPKEEPTVPIG
jgi:hypothetical protein